MALKELSPEDKQTIIEHMEALRVSLIVSLIAIFVAAIFCFYYSANPVDYYRADARLK